MRIATLLRRNLTYFWRTNVAVVLGVAAAVAALAGALLVGESVRASLRELALGRLGKVDSVISAAQFFRAALGDELSSSGRFAVCPIVTFEGLVTHEASGRRASGVEVYGVDDRFWKFQGLAAPVLPVLSHALDAELGSQPGDTVLLRVQKPAVIPLESLHGRKEDVGRTIRLSLPEKRTASVLAEFSIRPRQGLVRAIFVPLSRLARELGQSGKVNTILISGGSSAPVLEKILRERYSLEDLGVTLRPVDAQKSLAVESSSAMLSDRLADAAIHSAQALALSVEPVYTYLANTIRTGSREIPYSLVTADDAFFPTEARSGLLLNQWAAQELNVHPGENVSLDYYVWKGDGQLRTETAQFRLAGVLPISGKAASRDLAPDYPGITESSSLHSWDPPFPIDLGRVRPRDEEYWKRYRATPKAFIPLAEGQKLWGSRFGKLTSIRISGSDATGYAKQLRASLDPTSMGFAVFPARAQALAASRGATDFGEYFVYFSFFLVAAALLLAGLFFRLGVEQRMREIGTLRAMGFGGSQIRNLFLMEGAALAGLGCLAGTAGAIGYGALLMLGLRTAWSGAVGTKLLELHLAPSALAAGSGAGFVVALVTIVWTLRGLRTAAPRGLMVSSRSSGKPPARIGLALAAAGILLLVASPWAGQVTSFFGGGTLLMAAALFEVRAWLARRGSSHLTVLPMLGFRNAAWRPGRSVLCVALIASATFLIIAVDAFRREERSSLDPKSGTGGFPFMAESLLPLVHDPNNAAGREELGLPNTAALAARFVPFRLKPGDDASCLNLYEPRNPRILAPAGGFVKRGRFAFQSSLARTPDERRNPWLLLESELSDGAIPAIADANSLTYVLHRKLGEDFIIDPTGDHPVRLRMVAALADSIFQGELLISEKNFLRLFPDLPGYRFFLLEGTSGKSPEFATTLESTLSDYGFDVTSTGERLDAYHQVENTYISTFQALGALGLLLGTVGLAAVLARNVLERRRELALLRAVGYRRINIAVVILAENALLLVGGLAIGTSCALVAIAPAITSRGGHVAVLSIVGWLVIILTTGLLASAISAMLTIRIPLLPALRSD